MKIKEGEKILSEHKVDSPVWKKKTFQQIDELSSELNETEIVLI